MAELKVKSRTGLVQSSAKLLLRNVIRHTDTHNRLVEEAQMWHLYQKMKRNKTHDEDSELASRRKRKDSDEDRHQHTFRDPDVKNSFLYDDRQMVSGVSSSGRRCRAHMDYDDNDARDPTPGLSAGGSTYWMRQLEKAEAADGERWGHAGYKELYPQDFRSDKSGSSNEEDLDSDSSSTGDERRRRKRKKSKSDIREKNSLKRDKKRKKRVKKMSTDEGKIYEKRKKSKRKRRREEEDSDSDTRQTKRSKKSRSGSDRKKKRK